MRVTEGGVELEVPGEQTEGIESRSSTTRARS